MAAKQLVGLCESIGLRCWKITWPYRDPMKFLYFGSRADAVKAAKGLQGTWPYKPSIREIKI